MKLNIDRPYKGTFLHLWQLPNLYLSKPWNNIIAAYFVTLLIFRKWAGVSYIVLLHNDMKSYMKSNIVALYWSLSDTESSSSHIHIVYEFVSQETVVIALCYYWQLIGSPNPNIRFDIEWSWKASFYVTHISTPCVWENIILRHNIIFELFWGARGEIRKATVTPYCESWYCLQWEIYYYSERNGRSVKLTAKMSKRWTLYMGYAFVLVTFIVIPGSFEFVSLVKHIHVHLRSIGALAAVLFSFMYKNTLYSRVTT